jgi:hypothetical protein
LDAVPFVVRVEAFDSASFFAATFFGFVAGFFGLVAGFFGAVFFVAALVRAFFARALFAMKSPAGWPRCRQLHGRRAASRIARATSSFH